VYKVADTSTVDKALQDLERDFRGMRWRPFMEQEQRNLENIHRRYFDSFTGPDGKSWQPNAPATIKKKGHARRLHGLPSLGFRLRQSLTQPSSEFGIRYAIDHWPHARIVFGTDAFYHVYNQDGTRTIPARPHLGITRAYFYQMSKRANAFALTRITRIR
jgi:hypothetical protein